jgi:hypothetical protein
MKKILFIAAILSIAGSMLAAETPAPVTVAAKTDQPAASAATKTAKTEGESVLVYDVYKHMETASDVFLGIGGLSIGVGVGIIANSDGNSTSMGIGVENLCWGLVETGLNLYERNFVQKESDETKAREGFASMSGWHVAFDLAAMVAGGVMAVTGDKTLSGHGMGIMIQGGILAIFDSVNFFIAGNPEDIRDWGAN